MYLTPVSQSIWTLVIENFDGNDYSCCIENFYGFVTSAINRYL